MITWCGAAWLGLAGAIAAPDDWLVDKASIRFEAVIAASPALPVAGVIAIISGLRSVAAPVG